MAGRTHYRQSVQHHSNIAEACDALCGISIQFARKYLYLRTDRKAIFHLLAVFLLSLFAALVPLPNHYYFVKVGFFRQIFVLLIFYYLLIIKLLS